MRQCNQAFIALQLRSSYGPCASTGLHDDTRHEHFPLNALMIAVKALKRQSPSIEISSSEKAERVSNLIERLALFQRTPVMPAMPPIARSAQEM